MHATFLCIYENFGDIFKNFLCNFCFPDITLFLLFCYLASLLKACPVHGCSAKWHTRELSRSVHVWVAHACLALRFGGSALPEPLLRSLWALAPVEGVIGAEISST